MPNDADTSLDASQLKIPSLVKEDPSAEISNSLERDDFAPT